MPLSLRCALALIVAVVTVAATRAVAPPAPPAPIAARCVADLIRKLDHDSFHVRQKADDALRAMGKAVLPLVRAEAERTTSVEVRSRLRRIETEFTYEERMADLSRLLGNNDRRSREEADRMLRAAGPAVVPVLQRELGGQLTPVHRLGLQRLIADLSKP